MQHFPVKQGTVLILISSIILIFLPACGSTPTASTPAPAFEGRLLFAGEESGASGSAGLTVFELAQDTGMLQPLWADLPGTFYEKEGGWALLFGPYLSPDGTRALFSNAILDTATGTLDNTLLPDNFSSAVFSPDGSYLTFMVREGLENHLILLDLATGQSQSLFVGGCEEYSSNLTECAQVGLPVWVGSETLAFDAYVGAMPLVVTIPGAPELAPNHGFVVSIEGEVLYEFEHAFGFLIGAGPTVRVYQEGTWSWLRATELAGGKFEPKPLDMTPSTLILSPDGRYALALMDLNATIIELETGTSTAISNVYDQPIWSLDGKFIASVRGVRPNRELVVVPVDGGERAVFNLDEALARSTPGKDWDLWLLGWVP